MADTASRCWPSTISNDGDFCLLVSPITLVSTPSAPVCQNRK